MTIVILGGFLGSGKTSLLNELLAHYANRGENGKFAILMNEFGDIPVDTLLVNRGGLLMREITGGCICCSLKGRLLEAAAELVRLEEPDLLFIEATGIAVPSEIARTLSEGRGSSLPEQVRIRTLLCIDAAQYRRFSSSLMIFRRQLESAHLVYLTKSDILDPALLESVRAEIELPAAGSGKGGGREVFREMEELLRQLREENGPLDARSGGSGTGNEAQDVPPEVTREVLQKTFTLKGPLGRPELEALCAEAAAGAGGELLRMKGVAETEEGWSAFQYVNGTLVLTPCEAAPGRAGLVVISSRNGR